QRPVDGVNAFEVKIEAVIAFGQGVADDLLDRMHRGLVVAEQLMVEPTGEREQRRQDFDSVLPRQLFQGLIVATGQVAARVDGDQLRRDEVQSIDVFTERYPRRGVVRYVVAEHQSARGVVGAD